MHVFKDISNLRMNDNETMKISPDFMLSDFKETCNTGMFFFLNCLFPIVCSIVFRVN